MPGTAHTEACRVADDLCRLIANHAFQDDIHLTCSLGVAALQAGQSIEAWLQSVDTVLYEAKHQGRDQVVPSAEVGH